MNKTWVARAKRVIKEWNTEGDIGQTKNGWQGVHWQKWAVSFADVRRYLVFTTNRSHVGGCQYVHFDATLEQVADSILTCTDAGEYVDDADVRVYDLRRQRELEWQTKVHFTNAK